MTNNSRRHITKNQQAMLYAVAYPKKQQGKARTSPDSEKSRDVNPGRLSEARLVIKYAPEFVDDIIAGAQPLTTCYEKAKARRDEEASYARRLLLS